MHGKEETDSLAKRYVILDMFLFPYELCNWLYINIFKMHMIYLIDNNGFFGINLIKGINTYTEYIHNLETT